MSQMFILASGIWSKYWSAMTSHRSPINLILITFSRILSIQSECNSSTSNRSWSWTLSSSRPNRKVNLQWWPKTTIPNLPWKRPQSRNLLRDQTTGAEFPWISTSARVATYRKSLRSRRPTSANSLNWPRSCNQLTGWARAPVFKFFKKKTSGKKSSRKSKKSMMKRFKP